MPHSSPLEERRTVSDVAGGRGDAGRDVAVMQRLAAFFHDVGVEGERLPDLRLVGDVEQPHRFAFGHVALIGHPADDLSPEAVVIFVLDSFPPPPGAVGSHEQDLARAEGPRHQQRKPAEFVGDVFVHAQHVAAGLGSQHRGVPLEAGQSLPDLGVVVLASRPVW